MIHKVELLLVLVTIVLLTWFSASFADPNTENDIYDRQSTFYGRDILVNSSNEVTGKSTEEVTSSKVLITEIPNIDSEMYFWGVPDFSHQ